MRSESTTSKIEKKKEEEEKETMYRGRSKTLCACSFANPRCQPKQPQKKKRKLGLRPSTGKLSRDLLNF